MFDSSGKDQMPQKIAQVIGQNKQTQPHLIRDKMLAGQSRPVQGILAFLDPLLGLEWVLAISGVVLKAFWGVRYPRLSMCLYLTMGWLVLIAVRPLSLSMPMWGLFWLLTGGIAYTVGVACYAAKNVRYSHLVWHLFVMVGTGCHFIAVLWYAA